MDREYNILSEIELGLYNIQFLKFHLRKFPLWHRVTEIGWMREIDSFSFLCTFFFLILGFLE